MQKRDTIRIKSDKPRGILNLRGPVTGHRRYWPSETLAPFVEHYWLVDWDFETPERVETLPHPSVHLVLGRGHSEVVGVMRGRFTRMLKGRDRVVGTKFRPGGFRAFVDLPVSAYTDRRLPATAVFGSRAADLDARALCDDDAESIEVVESFLRGCHPVANEDIELCGRMVAKIAQDRDITRVDQIAEQFALSMRQLQRLFSEYVGVTPKWVIQRHRLIEAAERIAAGTMEDWAGLALSLGFADQAHFIRGFKKIVGRTPAEYARQF